MVLHDPSGGIDSFNRGTIGGSCGRFDQATSEKDPTSSVGAPMMHAQGLKIVQQTDRIPFRPGLVYGIAFVVRGRPQGAAVDVNVVLRSSSPCVLKDARRVVYHNDSILRVRIGELRHIGGRIAAGEDNHCVETPGPGTETFEFHYGGRKLVERTFRLFRE